LKFLGFHIGAHDCNFTITDGQKIKYFKTERIKQEKHHGYQSAEEFSGFFKKINLDPSEYDGIACATTPPSKQENEQWPLPGFFDLREKFEKKYYIKDYAVIAKTNMFGVNHHLCHKLSLWPIRKTSEHNKSIVLDGGGSWMETTTAFYKDKMVEKKYWSPFLGKPMKDNDMLSFATALQSLGRKWGIQGHDMDIAGKMMSLQSFGNIDIKLYNEWKNLKYNELHNIFQNIPDELDLDWLRTAHFSIENILIDFFKKHIKEDENFTYSGGIAQNIVVNTKLRKWNKNVVIPPHCSDDGLSLGCVEFLRLYFKQPEFDNSGFPFWQYDEVKETPTKETIRKVAEEIANGKIVGWCQGKGELGPRALGNRSILMRPDIKDGKDIINNKVKHREPYRPFGCSVLLEDVDEYFVDGFESPYMLYTMPLKDPEKFKSISHIDNTSRPQTVKDGLFAELLYEFKRLTGMSILLNTSLNINGKPIATPEVAETMNKENMGLDVMCIGNNIKIF